MCLDTLISPPNSCSTLWAGKLLLVAHPIKAPFIPYVCVGMYTYIFTACIPKTKKQQQQKTKQKKSITLVGEKEDNQL